MAILGRGSRWVGSSQDGWVRTKGRDVQGQPEGRERRGRPKGQDEPV